MNIKKLTDTKLELLMEVRIDYRPLINFSMQQNGVPVVNEIVIKNNEETAFRNLRLRISFDPAFGIEFVQYIDYLEAGSEISIKEPDIHLSTSFLSSLTERILGNFTLEISQEETVLYSETKELSILAFDEWAGLSSLPEILASFVTPNHPMIVPIINRASEILGKWTKSPSLDEYQTSDPYRVKAQVAAVYQAICEQNITYCAPPASFEEKGQRIRLYDDMLTKKMGTCIDMSLLFAGCLESIGLYPLLVMIKGHAFIGCWLVPDAFPDSVNDDPSLLSKRIPLGINEIVLVEATFMNEGKNVPFDEAVRKANTYLDDTDNFILFIDILRARLSHILPLPLRVIKDGTQIWIDQSESNKRYSAPKKLSPTDIINQSESGEVSKRIIWERKLLDLSLRNNLLNVRITKNTLQLLSVNIAKLEDALWEGQEFQILSRPVECQTTQGESGLYPKISEADPVNELLDKELKLKRLRSYLGEDDLARQLTHLYRSSRLSLEENGANTLYLAIGFLKWFETAKSTRARYAPILLLPIDMVRRSAAKGYVIRRRDEDMMVNITLLEMLRQFYDISITGLDPLPMDESGVNVPLVLNTIRQAIKDIPHWDVEEQSVVGNFSFSKFIMWNDIHNNAEKLSKNKFVESLVSGQLKLEGLDEETHSDFSEIVLPISADSSQMEAIAAAIDGKSFVLHGPPGTGKSQTITNIIANALYNGKKVLFVAEKMAALEVVQKRLASIGLSPFCLELHSNKAKKSAVLEQLARTTEVIKKQQNIDYKLNADKIKELREEINSYSSILHHKYPSGLSLYDCFALYSLYELPVENQFEEEFLSSLTPEKLSDLEAIVSDFESCSKLVGDISKHPLKAVQVTNPVSKTALTSILRSFVFDEILSSEEKLKSLLSISSLNLDKDKLYNAIALCGILNSGSYLPTKVLDHKDYDLALAHIVEICTHGKKRDEVKEKILSSFDSQILNENVLLLRSEYNEAEHSWFVFKLLKTGKLRKKLALYNINSTKLSLEDISKVISQISEYQSEDAFIKDKSYLANSLLGELEFNGGNCCWEKIIKGCEDLSKVMTYSQNLCSVQTISSLIGSAPDAGLAKSISILEKMQSLYNELDAHLFLAPLGDNFIASLKTFVTNLNENLSSLHDIISYNNQKEAVQKAGLNSVVLAAQSAKCVTLSEIKKYYYALLYKSYAEFIISKEPSLTAFHGTLFDEKIKRFRKLVEKSEKLTKEEIYHKLSLSLPSLQKEAASNSEVGILQRNIKNGGRGTSIRKLFDQISYLLPKMCPCMLMSPISVAQYIDASRSPFDLVIFDEASQMPTCEAVGAIARGSSIIVVGDPKQMPPTSFFSTNSFDEDNSDKEDLESILDDCLALSIPSKHLLWHYRSKHESLITFSNIKYYDTKLLTFPSPDDLVSKISYCWVDGVYDRGRSRQNKAEAKAVIEEIKSRLMTNSSKSIGVVTFNTNQQSLIEDLLNDMFIHNPELEALALECEEPIFVKNLENVQGDERDVILFSVGYGADKDGKVAMNFGPLNRDGGWRRLNVAVTRARYEMKVFSTLTADQIDLNRTSARGVKDLKYFLEYAQKGKEVIASAASLKLNAKDEFVHSLEKELSSRGYTVKSDIGCSGYKIDLAVVNPELGDKFVLGILCDGYNYLSGQTVRDREITQLGVLKALGWKYIRLWSMDWWEDREKCLKRICASIDDALSASSGSASGSSSGSSSSSNDSVDSSDSGSGSGSNDSAASTIVERQFTGSYYECNLQIKQVSPDDLVSGQKNQMVRSRILALLNNEAPISKKLLYKKLLNSFGISRIGARVGAYLDSFVILMGLKCTNASGDIFYWAENQDPTTYSIYRPKSNREALDIAPEEVANAAYQLLYEQGALPKEDLLRETAHLFNYSRLGDNVLSSMDRGVNLLISKGLASCDGGKIIPV